jgi:hypothetical protein
METTTSFDLNQAISRWRENVAHSPAFHNENLNELESHLRDSIAALQERGLSGEEAFLVGTKRLGKDDLLQKEFAKINQPAVWLDRTLWMLIGVQVWGLVSGIAGSMAQNAVFFGFTNWKSLEAKNSMVTVLMLTIAHLIFLTGTLVLCWWVINRTTGTVSQWVRKCLGSRRGLILITIAISSLSLSIMGAHFVMDGLQAMSMEVTELNQLHALYQQHSTFMMVAIQPFALVSVTLFLARKRLRLSGLIS